MAVRPEILAQLARMLGDDALRAASDEQVRDALQRHFDALVDALVEEIAVSDDVSGRESALDYAERRIDALTDVIGPATAARLRKAISGRLADW
jgi:hypothetical protein